MQVFRDFCVVSYWIDTLVLKTEGNTCATLLHHPFLFKGKNNASSRGSKKDFRLRCRGDLCQVKPYQVPSINSSPFHYIIRHSPLVFLSPTSKTIFGKDSPFSSPLFHSSSSFAFCVLVCWIACFVTMTQENNDLLVLRLLPLLMRNLVKLIPLC